MDTLPQDLMVQITLKQQYALWMCKDKIIQVPFPGHKLACLEAIHILSPMSLVFSDMNYWMANPNWGREYSLKLAWDPHRYKTPNLGLLAFPACQSPTHILLWETRRSNYKRNHIFSNSLVLEVLTRLSCLHLIHHFAFSPTLALPGLLISLFSYVFFFSTSPHLLSQSYSYPPLQLNHWSAHDFSFLHLYLLTPTLYNPELSHTQASLERKLFCP